MMIIIGSLTNLINVESQDDDNIELEELKNSMENEVE